MDWKNKTDVLERVKKDGLLLRKASKGLRNDPEVVLAAIDNDGWALEFASKELRNNKEIVLKAVYYDGRPLQFASKELQNDPEVVLAAMRYIAISDVTFQYASDKLKDNKEFVLLALKNKCNILKHVSDKLKDDKDVVLEAVKVYGRSLKYVSDRLKSDREVVLEAVKTDGYAIRFADKKFRSDREIAYEATLSCNFVLGMGIYPIGIPDDELNILHYFSEELEDDYELNLLAVKLYGPALRFLPEKYKNIREFVIAAVSNSPYSINYANNDLIKFVNSRLSYKRNKEKLIAIINEYFDQLEQGSKESDKNGNPPQPGDE